MNKRLFLSLLAVFAFQLLFAQREGLSGFSKGSTPEEVGKRLAYHFVNSRHDLYAGMYIHYAGVCIWNGAIDYALKTKDQSSLSFC